MSLPPVAWTGRHTDPMFRGTSWGCRGYQASREEVADVSEKPGKEWVGTPLDAVALDPRDIVEFDE
jgi:hypothetical protein